MRQLPGLSAGPWTTPVQGGWAGIGPTSRSPPDGGFKYNRDNWVEHLLGLLDALDLGTVSLMGNSFGGVLALWLASRYQERVHRLILMGSVGVDFPLTEGLDAVWATSPPSRRCIA